MIPVTAADREAVQLGHFVGDGPIGVDIVESAVGQVEGLFLVKGVDVFQTKWILYGRYGGICVIYYIYRIHS